MYLYLFDYFIMACNYKELTISFLINKLDARLIIKYEYGTNTGMAN